jgi:hypothetical protein
METELANLAETAARGGLCRSCSTRWHGGTTSGAG